MNLFGSFFSQSLQLFNGAPFYPLNFNGTRDKKQPIMVDMSNLLAVYLACPPLRAVIDRKAEMFSNMQIKLYKKKIDKDGNEIKEEVKNHKVLDLLNKPTPLHSQNNWLILYSIYKDIYNQTFTYKLKGTSIGYPKVLWHLPSGDMKVIPTGKLFSQYEMTGIIKNYALISGADDGMTETEYQPNEIIHITEGTSANYIVGESKLKSLHLPISNIIGAYKTRNILIHENAGITISSPDSKDADGMLPLGDKERKSMEEQFRKNYGLSDSQMHKIFSTTSMKVTPLIFPVKDMMLFEEIEGDFAEICQAFGMSRDIFPSTKGATFENQWQAEKFTYINTIIPEAEKFLQYFNKDADFGLEANGLYLEPCYEHVDVLKEDEKTEYEAEKVEEEAKKIKAETLSLLLKDGVINKEVYATMMEIEYTQSDDTQSLDDKIANAQVQLRGTVGGIEGLVNINTSVSQGLLDRNTAIAIVSNIYGYDATTASAMVTTTINATQQ